MKKLIRPDGAAINQLDTRKLYADFCEEAGTSTVITLSEPDGIYVTDECDDGQWYDRCVAEAEILLDMGWTAEEREYWEQEYCIYGLTADKIAELMEERSHPEEDGPNG
jgi:hypothetical protein